MNRMYIGFIIIGLILGAGIIGAVELMQPSTPKAPAAEAIAPVGGQQQVSARMGETIMTGTTGDGDVAIDLTPRGWSGGTFTLDIGVNTHSVDLSAYDLGQMTVLEYNGEAVRPVSAPQLSGHHNGGKLVFNVDGQQPRSVTVRIKGMPAVDERVFSWNG